MEVEGWVSGSLDQLILSTVNDRLGDGVGLSVYHSLSQSECIATRQPREISEAHVE
jgi:hypothetical protein